MIRSKNLNGFTLIEVLLALAIIGLVLTPMYIAQGIIITRVTYFSQLLDRTMNALLFLRESAISSAQKEQDASLEKKIQSPSTTLFFEQKKTASSDSPLKKLPHLYQQTVAIRAPDARPPVSQTILTYHYASKDSATTQAIQEKQ